MIWYLKKLVRKAFALLKRFIRFLLYLYFRFDKWHLNTLYEKKYAEDITRYLNSKHEASHNTVAEIGCGLGDIIRNVKYKQKYGYDADPKVLKAASLLTRICLKKKIKFSVFHFPESALTGEFDAIILVNWIHHIEAPILKSKLEQYFKSNLNAGGCIILDTVQDKEYRFNHNINYLAKDLNTIVTKLGDYERQRQVWAINK